MKKIPWNKGKKGVYSEATRKRISDTLKSKGILPPNRKGTTMSQKARDKISRAFKGKKHPNWRGGLTTKNERIRKSKEYKLWRKSVFERDNYQCIWGGKEHGSKLNADHIKPFALFPELRFAIDNGRTLCVECHRKTDTFGGKSLKTLKTTK